MRRIKFRAFEVKTKMMHQNVLLLPNNRKSSLNELLEGIGKKAILMQFTGLKDKNGKDVYESDILQVRSYRVAVVWFAEGACFRYSTSDGNLNSPLNYDDIEVIGNCWENPELLTKKE